jgi:gamma-glutamyl:cysteine ligase YbdK (ATP-grasp superfamily)
MGDEVNAQAQEPTRQQTQTTLRLALEAARHRQTLADQDFFKQNARTCNIEQEIHCLSSRTGLPFNAEAVINARTIPSTRFDTVTSILEFDASAITPLEPATLSAWYAALLERTRRIQEALTAQTTEALLVPIGVQPMIEAGKWEDWLVPGAGLRRRYHLIDVATRRENPHRLLTIEGSEGQVFTEISSYMAAMTRCAGTQFHIAQRNVEEALVAHNLFLFIAPILTALFGNSPFVGGIDSGRTSTRMDLLLQGEPLRAGLPRPSFSLYEYYEQQLTRASSPFFIDESAERALILMHGCIHTTSRIQVDMAEGTIRNEFRCIDAQSPFRSVQAFLLTLGAIDGLQGYPLATYEESQRNLHQAVWGLEASMSIQGRETTALALARELVEVALKTLAQTGFGALAREFLTPLLENELKHGTTQAQELRTLVQKQMHQGQPWRAAVVESLVFWNKKCLEGQ